MRPAQPVGRAGVVHLVGDDRAADAGELCELGLSRARHARPGLLEHARRALAEHEVERQIGQLGREARGEGAVPRADLDERERLWPAEALPEVAQVGAQGPGEERGRRSERS